MRFYDQPHKFYCGVDLHARSMYLCIRNEGGAVVLHRNFVADANTFLEAVAPSRGGLVVGCECMFGSIARVLERTAFRSRHARQGFISQPLSFVRAVPKLPRW